MNEAVYNILGEFSQKNGLLPRSKEVTDMLRWEKLRNVVNESKYTKQISDLNSQVSSLNSQLQKEQGWWDKWINETESKS